MFEQSAAAYRAAGDVDGELAALFGLGHVKWAIDNDMDAVGRLIARVTEIADGGNERARTMIGLVGAIVDLLAGEFQRALATLQTLPTEGLSRKSIESLRLLRL